jgi:hypothetical protein
MSVLEWYVVRGALLPFLKRSNARQAAFGAALAILISYNACLALGYGLVDSSGNSTTTGSLLFALPVLLFLIGFRDGFRIQPADFIFVGLVGIALTSFLVNEHDNDEETIREHLLLVATLSGYIACRTMRAGDAFIARSAFERITAAIVLIGAAFTAAEMIEQWDGVPGKPMVFGFNAAGTYFMTSLGFLVIALVTVNKPRPRRTFMVSALIFLPAAIFAAAMVRYTFLALASSMFVAMILAERGKRWHIAVVAGTIFLAVIGGLSARYSTAKIYASYILEQTFETSIAKTPEKIRPGAGEVPSCKLAVNTRNSIAIRQALIRDAVHLIPTAGLVGTGLDSFLEYSCIKAHQVHVSILQTAVELGWLGGLLLVTLMGLAIYGLIPLAMQSGPIRFILCSLVFAILLSLAHGRISRDVAVFALLGCAVGASVPRSRAYLPGVCLPPAGDGRSRLRGNQQVSQRPVSSNNERSLHIA